MMAVEVEHGGDGGAVGQGQHHDAAGLGAEGGRGGCAEAGRRHPVAWRPAERQIDPDGALEVELLGQAVGGQRRGRRKRGARIDGSLEIASVADRAGLLAVMEQDR